MELVEGYAPLRAPARDEVDGEEEVVRAVEPRVRDDVRVAHNDHAAVAVRVVNEQRARALAAIAEMRDGRGRLGLFRRGGLRLFRRGRVGRGLRRGGRRTLNIVVPGAFLL